MRLSDIEQNITKLAVRRFAEARMPTARREIIVTFKPYGPDTIHRLVAVNVLCALEPERIIPRVIAFHLCGWTDSRLQAKSAFEMVVSVLQRMYEITPEGVQPTTEALSSDMERSWPTVDPLVAWRGLYQCHEMGFVSGWAWEKELSEVQPLRINEGIMGIDASHYWGEYIRKESISVESSLQRAYSQKFLHRLSDVTGAREGIGIPPIKWVEIANNLKITQDDRDWIVRHLMTEELITKKPASSDVLALTQKAIVRLQGQRQSFALEEGATLPSTSEPKITERPELLVLISHSSKDHTLASALIDLLRSALGLLPSQIRCSSVDGYRLPGGVHTDTQLRAEVNASRVLIGLITPNSLASPYVLFELGARWGAGEVMIPLLAGVSTEHLRGPLSGLNVLVCSSEEQLHQALAEIGVYVELSLQSPAAYLKHLRSVMEEAQKLLAVNPPSGPTVGTKGIEGKKLRLSLTVVGTPPSPQMLRVQSNQVVEAIRLDYLLSTGACVASDNLNFEGESFDVPIEDHQVLKVWNTLRGDRNTYDNSGPAKLRIALLVEGTTSPYIVPIQMDSYLYGSTVYRKLAGAEVF